jgi:hypothetical protein
VFVDLGLVVLESSVCDGAHLAGLLLCKVRVGGWQVCADGSDNRASCVGDGALLVRVLEGRAGAGVLDAGGSYIGVVVDDRVAVVRDLGVRDRATSFRIVGIVVRVVGRERGGRGSDDGADLLSGGHG